jgi:CBS domain-containing protein
MKSRVWDVMTRQVVVVDESAPFKEIVELLEEHRVSALPVVDADDRVVGVVSEADLLLKEVIDAAGENDGRLFERKRRKVERAKAAGAVAADVMTAPAITVRAGATLSDAARLMKDHGIKRLPVVESDGKLVGIVSRADLLRVFLRPDQDIKQEIERSVIEETLWMDPSRVRVGVRQGVVTAEGTVEQRSMIPVLIGLIHGVEGVVGVEDRLTYEVDDVSVPPSKVGHWNLVPYGLQDARPS